MIYIFKSYRLAPLWWIRSVDEVFGNRDWGLLVNKLLRILQNKLDASSELFSECHHHFPKWWYMGWGFKYKLSLVLVFFFLIPPLIPKLLPFIQNVVEVIQITLPSALQNARSAGTLKEL